MENTFIRKCNKIGLITMILACVANFIPCIYMWLAYGELPAAAQILGVWGLAAAAYGVGWVTQPITFYPSLGTAGTYIANLAGSNADVRMPAANAAQKVAKTESGTPEGEAISTMAVASSVLITFSFVTLFTFIGRTVIPLFPPFVTTAFGYVLPALFGAIYADMMRKNRSCGFLTIVVSVLLFVFYPKFIPSAFKSLFTVIIGGICARVVYMRMKKGGAS